MQIPHSFPHDSAPIMSIQVNANLSVMGGSADVLVPFVTSSRFVDSSDDVGIRGCLEVKVKTATPELIAKPDSLRASHNTRQAWDKSRQVIALLRPLVAAEPSSSDSLLFQALTDLRKCGSRPIAVLNPSAPQNVVFKLNESTGGISVGGLAYCERLTCPLCADRLARRRAAAIIDGLHSRIDKAQNSFAVAVTLTVTHKLGESFETVYARLEEKIKKLTSKYRACEKKAVRAELMRQALCGYVASFETTIGRNGHHVHWHVLLWMPTRELAVELQTFVRTELCDEKLGKVGLDRAAEIIESKDMPLLISYVQKSMFEATGVNKTVHKNGNVGIFDLSSEWHVRMYAEIHCGAKGKRLFRTGGDFKKIIDESEENLAIEKDASVSRTVAIIVTDEGFDLAEVPPGAVVLSLDKREKLRNFCAYGGLYDCIEVLRRSLKFEDAREGIGKIFAESNVGFN